MSNSLRQSIATQVRQLVSSSDEGQAPLGGLHGEPGLFGPAAASWKVHGDFTSMMVGGTAALLLQMLHPKALAGVWDHSDFRADVRGRLRRTARFVAVTTYGSTAQAEAQIDVVKAIHDRVSGTLPDGEAYSANDPDLLTWVHAAGASSFLKAYLRYRDPQFSLRDQDRYFDETAEIARRLGAAGVPVTRRGIEAYLLDVRDELRCDERTREVARALMSQRTGHPAATPVVELLFQSAKDLLPGWAAAMHGFRLPVAGRPAIRLGTGAVGAVLRWALKDGETARRRAALAR
jgi:uncharacterized protein (DUF2236 family)